MLLSADNLTVSYGAITALRDVSVQIDRGEIVALIGANGAGKTTLLKTISGLLRPTSGHLRWQWPDGPAGSGTPDPVGTRSDQPVSLEYRSPASHYVDLISSRPDQIVRLGISHVPEGRQVFADLTVRENLMLGAYQRTDRTEIARGLEHCFSLFPVLAERSGQRSGTLSGGEQQMLAIGRALMAQPKLLLLDEPSLGLAPMIVQRIFQIIRQINQAGATIFLVEQNAHMALHVAHRGYVMETGQVTLADTAANLLTNPRVKQAYLGG